MRTSEEIKRQIDGLYNQQLKINAQINVLSGLKDSDEYWNEYWHEKPDRTLYDAAEQAQAWLIGLTDKDLFE